MGGLDVDKQESFLFNQVVYIYIYIYIYICIYVYILYIYMYIYIYIYIYILSEFVSRILKIPRTAKKGSGYTYLFFPDPLAGEH